MILFIDLSHNNALIGHQCHCEMELLPLVSMADNSYTNEA